MTEAPPEPIRSDAERLAAEPATTCLNCGAVLPGSFCPACGQKDQPLRQPAHVFIAESVSEYFGLDGRLWRSLGLLLLRPGALTVAYLDGRRTRYLRPLRLYLTATVLFFFLLSLKDPLAETTQVSRLAPVTADSIRVTDLDDRLDERSRSTAAVAGAVRAAAAEVEGLGPSVRLRALADSVAAVGDAVEQEQARDDAWLDRDLEDSLVAVASLPEPVRVALGDTGQVQTSAAFSFVSNGVFERLPNWTKGDLARRMDEASSPAERRLIDAQIQRAILGQIPTALFLILPVFALLLKLFYVSGAGRKARSRPSARPPLVPGAGAAPHWRRAWAFSRKGWWHVRRWRQRRRRLKARRKFERSRKRLIRGAIPRLRRHIGRHRWLRPWRVRRLRLLRRALQGNRTRYYAEHLVFALHVHAYTFLVLCPVLFVFSEDASTWRTRLGLVLLYSIPLYFLIAQHRVYEQSWPKTILKSSLLGIVYLIILAFGTLVAAGLALRLG